MALSLKKLPKTTLVFILMLLADKTWAQFNLFSPREKKNQYSSIGIGGGSSHYFGDLSPYSTFYYGLYTNVRWNGSFNYTRYLNERYAVRAAFSYIRLYGDDAIYAARNINRPQLATNYLRNLSFRNDIKEFSLMLIRNLRIAELAGLKNRLDFTPYIGIGLGLIAHNPKAREDANGSTLGSWVALRPIGTSGQGQPGYSQPYSYVVPVLPLSLGFRVKLKENIDLTFEGSFRLMKFDYLDDVGYTKYPSNTALSVISANYTGGNQFVYRANLPYDPMTLKDRSLYNQAVTLLNGPQSNVQDPQKNAVVNYPMNTADRGSKSPDSYITTQVTVNFYLGNSIKCPKIK